MKQILKHTLCEDTLRKLTELKSAELSDYVGELNADISSSSITFPEKVDFIINRLYQAKRNATIESLKRNAKLRYRTASIAAIFYDSKRAISRDYMTQLGTCEYGIAY